MFAFIAENWVTILLTAALAFLVGFVIWRMIKDKKSGKSSCGGDCTSCTGGCNHSLSGPSGK